MKAADGTIVEVFEWKSAEAIATAHKNPAVLAMWNRYNEACEIIPLASLDEFKNMFAGFRLSCEIVQTRQNEIADTGMSYLQ